MSGPAPTFPECVFAAAGKPALLREFDRLHGTHLAGPGALSPIERLVDETTGKHEADAVLFFRFVYRHVYLLLGGEPLLYLESAPPDAPVPLALDCPACGLPHIDQGEWATTPHKTHRCAHCGHEWRPFLVPTVGVSTAPSAGLVPCTACGRLLCLSGDPRCSVCASGVSYSSQDCTR